MTRRIGLAAAALAVAAVAVSCSSSASDSGGAGEPDVEIGSASGGEAPDVPAPRFVLDVRVAMDAVERELGGPQDFFEVTSNARFTNVFIAVDDGTAAVAYTYVDGELQPPAPKQAGATGNTFVSDDVDFVEERILSGVTADLPKSGIDAISVYGDGFGATYVLAATSDAGGFLDVVVGPEGTVFSVDPV